MRMHETLPLTELTPREWRRSKRPIRRRPDDLQLAGSSTVEHMVRRRTTIAVAAAVMLAFAGGCSSDNSSDASGAVDTTATDAAADETAPQLVGVSEFAERIDQPDAVTINVHVPDEGNLAGTDLSVPFDQISGSEALPDDLDTPLAVYCKSGNMSADAVDDLSELGYTDVVELRGGFDAWVDEGRPLVDA